MKSRWSPFSFAKRTQSRPAATPPGYTNFPYHAVALICGAHACPDARAAQGNRILSRTASPLPLPTCADPHRCTCHYLKFNDRRQEQRRMFGTAPDGRWYAGVERRGSRGRRATDH
jgi:hypothetical protein